jgi:hypothetical protein
LSGSGRFSVRDPQLMQAEHSSVLFRIKHRY